MRKEQKSHTLLGDIWAAKMVDLLIQFGLSMWQERNTVLRGGTQAIARTLHRLDIQQRIKEYYQATDHQILPHHRRRLFRRQLHDLLDKDTPTLKNWIRSYSAAQVEWRNMKQREKKTQTYIDQSRFGLYNNETSTQNRTQENRLKERRKTDTTKTNNTLPINNLRDGLLFGPKTNRRRWHGHRQ